MDKKLILASKSPRRRGFFDMLGLDYVALSPDVDESADPELSASEFVMKLAKSKAMAVDTSDAYVVAADTVVVQDGKILGKPRDRDDAQSMLTSPLTSTVPFVAVVMPVMILARVDFPLPLRPIRPTQFPKPYKR